MSNPQLTRSLKALKLSGLLATLDIRAQEAMGANLTHIEFLELLVGDEMAIRGDRAIARRIKAAGFRETRSIEDFDFGFNPKISRKQIMELAACKFIRERRDCLFIGPPGVGKSHIVQAVGHQAAKMGFSTLFRSIFDVVQDFLQAETFGKTGKMMAKYLKPDLLIIDDMGLKRLPKQSGEYLFEIIMRRFETRSTVMTSNRPLDEWGKLIGDVPTATAILDRFISRAEVIQITGRSYRLKDRATGANEQSAKTADNESK